MCSKEPSHWEIRKLNFRYALLTKVLAALLFHFIIHRVRTDLEKSLNLTLVLENSWNLKKVPIVLELSWNFVKSSLKIWISIEEYKIQQVLSDLWDAQKKLCGNCKKTEWKSLDIRRRGRRDSYSILINLCGSPSFYHQNQNQRKRACLFTSTFPAEKSAFFCFVLCKIGKKLSPWKMK